MEHFVPPANYVLAFEQQECVSKNLNGVLNTSFAPTDRGGHRGDILQDGVHNLTTENAPWLVAS